MRRAIHVDAEPGDANIRITLVPPDKEANRRKTWTTSDTDVVKFYEKDTVTIEVNAANCEPFTTNITFEELNTKDAAKVPYKVTAILKYLRSEIPVDLVSDGPTTFYMNGSPTSPTTSMVFVRENSGMPWHTVTVRAERPHYKTVEKVYEHDALESMQPSGGVRRQLRFSLEEIERPATLTVTANEEGAKIFLDENFAGNCPQEVSLMFKRTGADAPWSTHTLRVEKDEYEYRPPGIPQGQPAYQTNLTIDSIREMEGKLNLPNFEQVRVFVVPMHRFVVEKNGAVLVNTNSQSAKAIADGIITKMGDFGDIPEGKTLVIGKIGASLLPNSAGKPGQVVLSVLVTQQRADQAAEIIGSEIYLLTESGLATEVTGGDREIGTFDFDPCITKDGKYVYYSSTEGGRTGIWRKLVTGETKSQIEPDRGIDVEPSVFTSVDGNYRVAFTRYAQNAAPGAKPYIMIEDEDRKSFGKSSRSGRSPAWSNDGSKIAYVSYPDNKICVMDADGKNNQILTSGKTIDDTPVWLPGDQQILYASAKSAQEARGGTGDYDLWKVDLQGHSSPVLENQSFDGMPAVTSENIAGDSPRTVTYVYFISNRGAQGKNAENAFKIHYFELQSTQ